MFECGKGFGFNFTLRDIGHRKNVKLISPAVRIYYSIGYNFSVRYCRKGRPQAAAKDLTLCCCIAAVRELAGPPEFL